MLQYCAPVFFGMLHVASHGCCIANGMNIQYENPWSRVTDNLRKLLEKQNKAAQK